MNEKIAEDMDTVARQTLVMALSAAYLQGYHLGAKHGEERRQLHEEQSHAKDAAMSSLNELLPDGRIRLWPNE